VAERADPTATRHGHFRFADIVPPRRRARRHRAPNGIASAASGCVAQRFEQSAPASPIFVAFDTA
jgi:hypothetical protein